MIIHSVKKLIFKGRSKEIPLDQKRDYVKSCIYKLLFPPLPDAGDITPYGVERLGAKEACWAHNPKVPGSKPGVAISTFCHQSFGFYVEDVLMFGMRACSSSWGMESFR
jgi:hypothetical protein